VTYPLPRAGRGGGRNGFAVRFTRARGPTPHPSSRKWKRHRGRQECSSCTTDLLRAFYARGEHGLKLIGTLLALGLGGMYQRLPR
jgi:hypothetical protein